MRQAGLACRSERFAQAGEGFKKNPQPSHRRLGILPACTLHSLILEDLFVKNIQAGFLTLPTLTRLPTLPLRPFDELRAQGFGQWLSC
jgi:hypothetical protein